MAQSPSHFILPDLFSLSSALQFASNPFWKRGAIESRRWVDSYRVFADRRRAFFLQGQSELLCSHSYPYAGYEEFRTCCDLVNLLFVIDELSDEQSHCDARQTGEIFLRALRDPTWSDGSKLAQMTAEYVYYHQIVRTQYLILAPKCPHASYHGHQTKYVPSFSRPLRCVYRFRHRGGQITRPWGGSRTRGLRRSSPRE